MRVWFTPVSIVFPNNQHSNASILLCSITPLFIVMLSNATTLEILARHTPALQEVPSETQMEGRGHVCVHSLCVSYVQL